MATKEQFDAVVARLNTATSAAGAKIQELKGQLTTALADAGVLGADEQAILDQLGATADALEAMAQDPDNPVPTPVPEPNPVPNPNPGGEV